MVYMRDKVLKMANRSVKYGIANLAAWWGDKAIEDVTPAMPGLRQHQKAERGALGPGKTLFRNQILAYER